MNKLMKLCRAALSLVLAFALMLSLCANGLSVFAAEDTDADSRKDAILKEIFGDGVSTEEAFDKVMTESETMIDYENQPFYYVPNKNSYYVALGDETGAKTIRTKSTYVNMLASALGVSYKNLCTAQLAIQDAYQVVTDNASDIAKADLISIGWSNYGATFNMAYHMAYPAKMPKVTTEQWEELVGEENLPLVDELLDIMFQKVREQNLSQFGNYDFEGGLEWYAFTYLGNAIHQSQLIEAVRVINPNAVIILIGTYNDLQNVVFNVNDRSLDLGEMMDDLVRVSNLLATRNAEAYARVAYVDAPDVSSPLDALDPDKTSPETYITRISTRQGLPNSDGHTYIKDQILASISDKCSHIWDEGVVTKNPTCQNNGTATYTCKWCGESKNESIPATGEHILATREENRKEATCGAEGSYDLVTYCTSCKTVIKTEKKTIPATGKHSYTAEVTTQPGCGKPGVKTYTCKVCGDSYQEDIPAAEHNYQSVVTAPTCTAEGFTTYTCTLCGDSYVADKVPATDHAWNVNVKDATCCEDGLKTNVCANCGEMNTEVIPATGKHQFVYADNADGTSHSVTCGNSGKLLNANEDHAFENDVCTKCGFAKVCAHQWDAGVVTVQPTCRTTGEIVYTCTKCQEKTTETLAIDPNAHTGNNHVENAKEATCTEAGYTGDTVCECGAIVAAGQVIPAMEHSFDAVESVPTCCENGLMTYTCSVCGAVETEVIPATDEHDLVYSDNEDGATHSVSCRNSGKELKEKELHSFVDGACSNCGAKPICDHQWDEGVVTVQPTCCANGEIVYTCSTCGVQYTEILSMDPNAHTGNNHVENAKEATCTEPGYTGDTVCECGTVVAAGQVIPVLEHSYESVVTAPTCTEDGFTTYICAACGATYIGDQTAATGHAWDDGVITKAPTATEDGEMTYTCTYCGETKVTVIEKTGEDEDVIYDLPEDNSVSMPENDCFEGGTIVEVERIEAGDIFENVQQAMQGRAEKYVAYEFVATKDGISVQPNGKLEVTFVIPEGFSSNIAIYYLKDNGSLEKLECTVDAASGKVTVELEHFSTYILADEDSAPEIMLGDVNGDGRINVRDARAILRYVAGLMDAAELNMAAADYNGDGRVNVRDARAILRRVAGLD